MDMKQTEYSSKLTMGSLFDGSGSFPYVGEMCGVETKWTSEIEPYPTLVSKTHFPNAEHLGDIKKLNGEDLTPVDIITFGSPCQSMSIAGQRKGMKHESLGDDEETVSGLFMEAMRVIREMREKTNGRYPRIILWENVATAFSSSRGEDFRTVLQEIEKTATRAEVHVPRPTEHWATSGSVLGDGYSISWRVLDAQFWGVPQRRRRIYLVGDFTGRGSEEILFNREGLSRHFRQSGAETQGTTRNASQGTRTTNRTGGIKSPVIAIEGRVSRANDTAGNHGLGVSEDVSYTITTQDRHAVVFENPRENGKYEARRITPLECSRLQGLPDWWQQGLDIQNPTEEDLKFWRNVFSEYRRYIGKKVDKTDNEIKKWLRNPYGEFKSYKLMGKGIAIPTALYVMEGITEYLTKGN